MTADAPAVAIRRFADYFGELGPRWGLPADACRVHAYLYVSADARPEADIAAALSLDQTAIAEALAFLTDHEMVDRTSDSRWQTGGDPWVMLVRGLEQRGRRELPQALSTLQACHRDALAHETADPVTAGRIAKVLSLVEDLAALDAQARRLPPRLVRAFVGMSGRAARLLNRGARANRGEPS